MGSHVPPRAMSNELQCFLRLEEQAGIGFISEKKVYTLEVWKECVAAYDPTEIPNG